MPTPGIDPITADVLHSAVHDLIGPANRLRTLTQLLVRGANWDEDSRKLLGHVAASASDVASVAEGLRAYAETCTRPLHIELVDLNRPLSAAVANLRAEIESVGARITSSTLPEVRADPFLMTWLLQELLTNAIRFRSATAPLISVCGEPAGAFISVSDNGPGIDAGSAERVFRPFRKLPASQGAGLGLTICRTIIERHGGQIRVEPRDCGAEIRFSLDSAATGNDGRL